MLTELQRRMYHSYEWEKCVYQTYASRLDRWIPFEEAILPQARKLECNLKEEDKKRLLSITDNFKEAKYWDHKRAWQYHKELYWEDAYKYFQFYNNCCEYWIWKAIKIKRSKYTWNIKYIKWIEFYKNYKGKKTYYQKFLARCLSGVKPDIAILETKLNKWQTY